MKKRLLLIFTVAVCLLMSMCIFSSAADYHKYDAYTTGKITNGPLNVRASYSTSSSIKGTVDKGSKVTLKGYIKANGTKWYRITYKGEKGYICADYVKKVSSVGYTIYTPYKYGKITADPSLNVRSKPSTSSNIIGSLKKGKKRILRGTVTKNGTKWYKITYDGKAGYISAEYVKRITKSAYNASSSSSYVKYETKKYGKVTASPCLCVRTKASTSGTKLGTLSKGTKKILYGYKKSSEGVTWYKIKYGEKYGYICGKYVKKITKSAYNASSSTKASTSATGSDIVDYAFSFKGVPYKWAGATPEAFDCSGFVMYVYAHFGISLPHNSWSIESYGTEVLYSNAKAGDVICFGEHVGIYVGDGKMVHASESAGCVTTGSATYTEIRTVRRFVD